MLNYVYNILLNFHEKYYDFYDWNQEDIITRVREIPIFRVDRKTMITMLNNDFIINDSFLKEIENVTQYFVKGGTKKATAFILINSGMVLAIEKHGSKFLKSSLQLYELNEILELEIDLPKTKIPFEVIRTNKIELLTRKQEKNLIWLKKK